MRSVFSQTKMKIAGVFAVLAVIIVGAFVPVYAFASQVGVAEAVYVDGQNGNDDNDGSKESPVRTWGKAKELAASDGTIYVAGTLDVGGDISSQQVVKRASGFTGDIFKVSDSANFTNIHIAGNGETATGSAITFTDKGAGNSLVVGKGVVIDNIVSTGSGAAVYVSDAVGASVTFDGAQFLNNTSYRGGAVYILTAPQTTPSEGFTVTITGGAVFDGNTAQDEGGAVYLNGGFVTNIDSAQFTNNKAAYGAAIVNYNHTLANEINIVNGLIVGNKTGEGPTTQKMPATGLSAGGVNICMAGAAEVNISSENGVAIFDNDGPKGDIAVWDNSDVSKLKVNEGAMLGGGNHNWEPAGEKGYKASPSEADKAKARNAATVIFENNTSDYHGAIMSNGIVQFGTKLAELRIKKIDAVTGEAMNGVVFELTSEEKGITRTAETFVEAGGEAEYFGVASFTDLPDGVYTLTEQTPAGYRGTMPWTVTIQNSQVTIEDTQGLVEPVEGKYYNFIISNQPVTGEEKDVLISKNALGGSEIEGAQMKVTDAEGNVVGEWTSTTQAHTLTLVPGEYTMEELVAPAGYDAVTTKMTFKVNEDGTVELVTTEVDNGGKISVTDGNHVVLEDAPSKPVEHDVVISKQELGDDTKELPGAEIVVKDAEGNEVDSWTSTDEAHKLKLEAGEYTLEEVNAPEGFEKITTIIKFIVKEDGTVEVTNAEEVVGGEVTVKDVNHLVLEDMPKKYDVVISKQELGDDTKELPGAEIVVKDAEGNEVDSWTSTDEAHKLKLEAGEYTLEEVNAPEGFDKITTIIKFIVKEDGSVEVTNAEEVVDGKVSVKDVNHLILEDMPKKPVEHDVVISKQDLGDDTKELPGAEIVVKDAEGNEVDSWTSTDEAHKLKLEAGEYTLEEVNAPEGFEKITTIIKFIVKEDGTVEVTNAEEVVGGEVTVKDVNHLILKDTPKPTAKPEQRPTPEPTPTTPEPSETPGDKVTETPTEDSVKTPAPQETPKSQPVPTLPTTGLPQTGAASGLAMTFALALLGAGVVAVMRRRAS